MKRFAQWINDLRWAANMRRARRWRRILSLEERVIFDDVLCEHVGDVFFLDIEDVGAAMFASKGWIPHARP